ncbi:MAG: penicillin-binding transpeptidase domain-containing protein [Desulfobacterales bacterium]
MTNRPNWKQYQAQLQRKTLARRFLRRTRRFWGLLPVLLLVVYGLTVGLSGSDSSPLPPPPVVAPAPRTAPAPAEKPAGAPIAAVVPPAPVAQPAAAAPASSPVLTKSDLQVLIDHSRFINLTESAFPFEMDGQLFKVETSLNPHLQSHLLKRMDREHCRYIAVVAMEPASGRLLAMAGFDKDNPTSANPCIETRFPAASIFKIVTAAAAVEKLGFRPGSSLSFNGGKYTLYKSQLKDQQNRYTRYISFQDSFAQSVNPVFGKLGARSLGKNALEQYAEAFGFNRPIQFEIPLAPSTVSLSDEPYQWAEIASGFNRQTIISPLHGAMLAATILNGGQMVAPTIVDQITDAHGRPLYHRHRQALNRAISPTASKIVNTLMEATVQAGTSRKAFKGYGRDRVLSRLNIGGKTGSISNRTNELRYDWFVGFAEEKNGSEKIAISVVVAHEKYIGTRAGQYARLVIERFFGDYFTQTAAAGPKASS